MLANLAKGPIYIGMGVGYFIAAIVDAAALGDLGQEGAVGHHPLALLAAAGLIVAVGVAFAIQPRPAAVTPAPTTAPAQGQPTPELLQTMDDHGVQVDFSTPTPNFFIQMLPLLLPLGLVVGFFIWMNRRAQGQMSGIMSIGRSRESDVFLPDLVAGHLPDEPHDISHAGGWA